MKHVLRNALIAGFYYTGLVWLYKWRTQRHGPMVRIVCLHDVTDRCWFETFIKTIKKQAHILTPTEFETSDWVTDRINILLTFDDGYQSWIDVVLPVLVDHGLQGIFFVNSGLLDAANNTEAADNYVKHNLELNASRQLLTWTGATQLVAAGQTIGGHTKQHLRLPTLDPAARRAELGADKSDLETRLQITLKHFAYPFGTPDDFDAASESDVKSAGYFYSYTAVSRWATKLPSLLPRTLLDQSQSPRAITQWVAGGYDLFSRIKGK